MTNLTNTLPEYTYGDLLTTTNDGQGLTSTLKNLQDGFGNNSTIQIATNAVNFNRSGATFQLDSVAVTSLSVDINSVCKPNPILPGTGSVTIPIGSTAQRSSPGVEGMFRYNSQTDLFEGYSNGTWIHFTQGGVNSITGTANQIVVTGDPDVTLSLANNVIVLNSISTPALHMGTIDSQTISGDVNLRLVSVAADISLNADSGNGEINCLSGLSVRSGKLFNLYNSGNSDSISLTVPSPISVPYRISLPNWTSDSYGMMMFTDGAFPLSQLTFAYPNYFYNRVAQASHGFTVGQVLRMTGAGVSYSLAQANSASNAEVVGIVAIVIDANFFVIQFGGLLEFGISATSGIPYYLSPTTPGAYTSTAPTTSGQVIKPLFIANTSSTAYWINQRGNIIP